MKKCIVLITLVLFFWGCSKTPDTPGSIAIEPPLVLDTVTISTVNFKGLNWADARDNFTDDWLVPSGLSSADNYSATLIKADNILAAFGQTGANTIRLPVNPPTVLQNWWPSYTAAIDKASAKGMKVILACWEGANSKNGKVDNEAAFWLMWQTIVEKYVNNPNVFFEPFNEPHGYDLAALKDLYAKWITTYPTVPKRRIMLDGAGYATDVNSIGADSRFNGCLLSFHDYTWFENKQTVADWEIPIKSLKYPERTVVTEFGIPMTNGKDYLGVPAADVEIAYFQGMTNQMHDLKVGGVYWPGLRTNDTYSLLTLNGSALATNNPSGLTRLRYAWGTGTIQPLYAVLTDGAMYKIINRNSNKSLDVNGGATGNGGEIIQWDYSGGANQQWQFTGLGNGLFSVTNKNSGKALDVNGGSSAAGTKIIQWDYNGATNQQWQIIDIGFGYYKIYNIKSGQSLDVNGGANWNGAGIIQWHWNNGANQQWSLVKL